MRTKARLELTLVRDIKGNAESFLPLNKENMYLLVKKTDDSVSTDTVFIALVFTDKLSLVAVSNGSIQEESSAVNED